MVGFGLCFVGWNVSFHHQHRAWSSFERGVCLPAVSMWRFSVGIARILSAFNPP